MKVAYCSEGFWVDIDKLEVIDGTMVVTEISEGDINKEIGSLKAELAKERTKAALIATGNKLLRAELDSWRNREGAVCPEDVPFEDVIADKDKRIEELEAEIARLEDDKAFWKNPPNGVWVEKDKIAEAWKNNQGLPYFCETLSLFNIHRCEVCRGSGRWRVTSEKCPTCAAWGSHGFVVKP